MDGDYDFSVVPGLRHKFALKGAFEGATITLKVLDGPFTNSSQENVFVDVIDGVFTDVTENTLEPTGRLLRLTVADTGPDTSISVTCIPLNP